MVMVKHNHTDGVNKIPQTTLTQDWQEKAFLMQDRAETFANYDTIIQNFNIINDAVLNAITEVHDSKHKK